LEQGNFLLGEGGGLKPPDDDGADRHLLAQQGYGESRANPDLTRNGHAFRKLGGLALEVNDVNRPSLEDRATGRKSSHERHSRLTDRADDRDGAMVSDDTQHISVHAVDHSIDRVTEARRLLRDGVENGLKLSRCAGDGAEDLTRRRLLLQGFGQGALHIRI
jgi:hypothetical protein